MGYQLTYPTRTSVLAGELGLAWHGPDLDISHVRSLHDVDDGALSFTKVSANEGLTVAGVVIAPPGTAPGRGAVIEANNPRLYFARALIALNQGPGFAPPVEEAAVATDAIVSPTAVLGRGVVIGPRTVIGHHVVIADGVRIGADCIVKSNTVIGEPGFGFERDEDNIPVRLLHLGNVIIGDRVEIGSLNTVCRATLGNTVIEDDVKTDDHVHIAHNCHLRRGALLTACVELSGGVDVGEHAWIGPNSSVIQKVKIGNRAFVGIGANVTKPVPDDAVVAGNPAKVLRFNK